MNKERLVAYTDAIVAIVVTLLVLELPHIRSFTFHAMFENWRAYLIYLITFVQIMAIWIHHHNMLQKMKRVTQPIYWANALWLLGISLLPYASGWIADYPTKWQPEIFYIIILFIGNLGIILLQVIGSRSTPEIALSNRQISLFLLPYVLGGVIAIFIPFGGILLAMIWVLGAFFTANRARK